MQVAWPDFDPTIFSFHDDPVLVIENFWTAVERRQFRDAMQRASWQTLHDMPTVHTAFPDCGNWRKGRMAFPEIGRLLERLAFPCIEWFMESFPGVTGRSLSFSYYSYKSGDCLLTHDDTAQTAGPPPMNARTTSRRRLALVSYVHDEWEPDWGGELIIYEADRQTGTGRPKLRISHCIAPEPGSLVLFSVPRYHRVCRVDPVAGEHARLSIAGWLLTDHVARHPIVPNTTLGTIRTAQKIACHK
jgi:SM-20-related protein